MSLVKKNIEVAESRREAKGEEEKRKARVAKLKEKRDSLLSQISTSRASISKLQSQTRQTHMELASLDRSHSETQRMIDEHDSKTMILDAFEKQVSRVNTVLHKFHFTISQLLSQLQNSSNSDMGSKGDGESKKEEANEENTLFLNLYAQIHQHLQHQIDSNQGLSEEEEEGKKRMKLPEEVEEKVEQYISRPSTRSSLLTRLSLLAKQETDLLESSTEKMEVSEMEEAALARLEKEDLSSSDSLFSLRSDSSSSSEHSIYSKPYHGSSSSPRSKLISSKTRFPTVEELLEAQRAEHVNRFLSSEKCLNAAHSLQKQLESMLDESDRREEYHSMVKQMSMSGVVQNASSLSENVSPNISGTHATVTMMESKTKLREKLSNMELVVCAEEAAYESSLSIIDRLKDSKRRLERDLKLLKDKFARIQQLEGENQARQALCAQLLKDISASPSTFSSQCSALQSFLNAHLVDSQRILHQERLSGDNELTAVPMAREIHSLLSSSSSLPSPSPLFPSLSVSSSTLNTFVSELDLCAHQSVDNLVSTISSLLFLLERHRLLHSSQLASFDSIRSQFSQFNDETALHLLQERTALLEKSQTETWLPLLSSSISQITKATSHCESIQQLCSDFVHQPAQHLAPWLKSDGKTFEATLASWRSSSHALRLLHRPAESSNK